MTTHRLIQVSQLHYTLTVNAKTFRRCADNLARIKNNLAAGSYLRKAIKAERVAALCQKRLGAHA